MLPVPTVPTLNRQLFLFSYAGTGQLCSFMQRAVSPCLSQAFCPLRRIRCIADSPFDRLWNAWGASAATIVAMVQVLGVGRCGGRLAVTALLRCTAIGPTYPRAARLFSTARSNVLVHLFLGLSGAYLNKVLLPDSFGR